MEDFLSSPKEENSVDVYIRVSFTKIYDIDTINQRFQAEVLIESKWSDPNVKNSNFDVSKLNWKPDLYIENAINDPREEIAYKVVEDNNNSIMVSEIRKVKGLFWENLELENFPLDIQNLSIIVATKKSGKKINFILIQAVQCKIKISNTLDKSAWYLHEVVKTNTENIEREFSFGIREYPAVRLTCQAFRLPGYFYWNALLPIVLITFAAIGPFVIDYKAAHTRLPSTATMLLSSVSFKAVVNRLLPTVSYLTSLDKYSLSSIVIISGMFIYHSFFAAMSSFLSDSSCYYMDKLAFVIFTSLILAKQFTYGFWLMTVSSLRQNLIQKGIFYEHGTHKNDSNLNMIEKKMD